MATRKFTEKQHFVIKDDVMLVERSMIGYLGFKSECLTEM
jgi:hypothetical protein